MTTPALPSSADAVPTVSVVIPAYNFGRYIEESVGSVLAQDVTGLEVIVVDDGSTDDTIERLGRIADPRLRVVRLDHVGVGAARNHALHAANGRYIAFLDADDRWRAGKLRRQLAVLESEPSVGFVFTNFVRFDESGFHDETQFDLIPDLMAIATRPSAAGEARVIEGDTFCALAPLAQLPCWTQSMLIRSALARASSFPQDMRLSQDLYYILDVYRQGRGAYIVDPIVEVRRHAANSYRRANDKLLPDIDGLTRILALASDPDHRRVLRQRLGRAWLSAGYHFFWAGDATASARACVHALRYDGTWRRAIVRLLMTPLAPLLARYRGQEGQAFPSARP